MTVRAILRRFLEIAQAAATDEATDREAVTEAVEACARIASSPLGTDIRSLRDVRMRIVRGRAIVEVDADCGDRRFPENVAGDGRWVFSGRDAVRTAGWMVSQLIFEQPMERSGK